jgi:SAM-dependent methyltransferase
MPMVKSIGRAFAHLVFRPRQFQHKCVRAFSQGIKNQKILELGSGKIYRNGYYYSDQTLFDNSNEFIQSDIVEEYGHRVIDVTTMTYEKEFDIILCANVLEHVFDFYTAIEKLHTALKPNGVALILVPAFYPLHDEPADYWRFTEHSLRKLLKNFSRVKLKHSGIRQYPFAYFIEATK